MSGAFEYIAFETAFEIDCVVNRCPMVAFVTGEYKIPFLFAHQVNFSHEYSGIFVEITLGFWKEETGNEQVYDEAIGHALDEFHRKHIDQKWLKNYFIFQ